MLAFANAACIANVLQAKPLFKDRKKFLCMADPMLYGQYPIRGLYQAIAVAAMCVQEQADLRPVMVDVVTAMNYLAAQTFIPETQPVQNFRVAPSTPPRPKRDSGGKRSASGGSQKDRPQKQN